MKTAVVGSRSIVSADIAEYIPDGTTEIISGGARGADTLAREYAQKNNIKLTEFLPEYDIYKRSAPLRRNIRIIESADIVVALWDGHSRGTKHVIDSCRSRNIKIIVHIIK